MLFVIFIKKQCPELRMCIKITEDPNNANQKHIKFMLSVCLLLRISPHSVQMTGNAGKMRTSITPNTGTFYAVIVIGL